LALLADESFDVVILDRRIPTEDDDLDDHADHGWEVFQAIRQNHTGTSVWFLTGTVDADFATELLHLRGTKADVHGQGELEAVYRVYWKNKMVDCVTAIGLFRGQVELTATVTSSRSGRPSIYAARRPGCSSSSLVTTAVQRLRSGR
jgi:DNA-binding NarL/FixJ family response regulator